MFSADSVSGIPYRPSGSGSCGCAADAGRTQPRDFSSRWRGGGCKRGGRRGMKGGTWLHFRPAIRLRCWILGAWPGPWLPPQDPVSQSQSRPRGGDDASHHPADSSIMMHHQAIPSLPAGGPPFEGPVLGTARLAVAQHLFSPARALPRGARPDWAETVQPLPPTRPHSHNDKRSSWSHHLSIFHHFRAFHRKACVLACAVCVPLGAADACS